MNAILTIEDLLWAQENDPALVEKCLAQVTIMEDLERYLQWLDEAEVTTTVVSKLRRNKARGLGIHPSSACKNKVCLLKLYYECTGEITPNRAYNQRDQLTWDIGTLLHDSYQTHLKNMYEEQFKAEVPLVDKDLHIDSRTDGIFFFSMVKAVLEMKSIKEKGNYGWEKVQKEPMADNVRQAYFYMYVEDAPFAIIFYMNKNAGLVKEHPVMFDPTVWEQIKTETVEPVVAAAFGEGKMVQASPGYGCRWCDFNHRCKAANREKMHVKGSSRPWGRQ